MNTLQTEQHRLYRADRGSDPDTFSLVSPDGRVRALVLELARPADWNALGAVWRGVQADLELPAPAIAVNGVDGYQLWFSLAEPVAVADAQALLEGLRQRYLGTVAKARVGLWPAVDASASNGIRHARLVPESQAGTGHWSACVAPDLAAIFADEPWLDLTPSPEAQAGVLSGIRCIAPVDFQRALEHVQPAVKATAPQAVSGTASALVANRAQPQRFLLDVMNDPGVEMHLRIEAAKALLPYIKD